MAVLGPIKVEIINLSGTNDIANAAGNPGGTTQTGVSTADTIKSQLQRPEFAIMVGNVDGVDGWATAIGTGATAKVITMTNAGQSTAAASLLIFGF